MSTRQLADIHVTIVEWVDDHQPGTVACSFVDRFGTERRIVEKLPVVVEADGLWGQFMLPAPGRLRGRIVREGVDEIGQPFAIVDISDPWDIEATDGLTIFEMPLSGLTPRFLLPRRISAVPTENVGAWGWHCLVRFTRSPEICLLHTKVA